MSDSDESYAISEIFERWRIAGVSFTEGCIQEHTDTQVTLYFCKNCDFGIFQPAVTGTPGFYEELQTSSLFTYYPGEKWEFRQAQCEIIPNDAILEIGCGDGTFLQIIKEQGAQPFGIEYNDTAVQQGVSKGFQVTKQPLDIFSTEHSNEFDMVCAFQVLEHVSNPLEFLQQMARCTRSGGEIVIAVPNHSILRFVYTSLFELPPHHAIRWTARNLNLLGEKIGLTATHVISEPLASEHFSVATYYWYHLFGGRHLPDSRLIRFIRSLGGVMIMAFMDSLKYVGIRSLPMFQGHSLYAIFEKS
jgi:2-polyprenyl-3-methyl-5-hydroxy-6-metoxy-1,4-benzoquinol methylase